MSKTLSMSPGDKPHGTFKIYCLKNSYISLLLGKKERERRNEKRKEERKEGRRKEEREEVYMDE